MKARVDAELCIGCQACVDTCPDVFQMDGDKAKVVVDSIPAQLEDSVKEAKETCPVEAISIE